MSGGLRKECSEAQSCANGGTTSALVGNAWGKDGLVNPIGMSQPGPCLLLCPVPWAVCSFGHGTGWPPKWWCKSGDISHTAVPVYNALSASGWWWSLHSSPPLYTQGQKVTLAKWQGASGWWIPSRPMTLHDSTGNMVWKNCRSFGRAFNVSLAASKSSHPVQFSWISKISESSRSADMIMSQKRSDRSHKVLQLKWGQWALK